MQLNIRTKLTACFLLLCIVPSVVLATYATMTASQSLKEKEIEKFTLIMEGIVAQTRQTYQDTEFLLKNLSSNQAFISVLENTNTQTLAEANRNLRKIYVDSMGHYESVYLVSTTGRTIADSLDRTGYSLGSENIDFVMEAIEKRSFQMSDVYFSDISQTRVRLPLVSMAYPVQMETGQVLGAIVITVGYRHFDQNVRRVEISENGYGFVLNSNGEYLSHHDATILLSQADDPVSLGVMHSVSDLEMTTGYQTIDVDGVHWTYFFTKENNTKWLFVFALPDSDYLSEIDNMRHRMMGIVLLSMMIAIGISWLVVRYFSREIKSMVVIFGQIAQGDFSIRSESKAKDEFGVLSNSINEMIKSQNRMVRKLLDASVVIKNYTQEVFHVSEDAQAFMTEVSSEAQTFLETAHENKKLSKTIEIEMREITENAQVVDGMSKTAVEIAKQTQVHVGKGLKSTQEALHQIIEIESRVHRTSDHMDQLVMASEKINSFVDYIKNISNATNLLALNASIEAARAGEYGRGFSVVAGEIRNLSVESKEAVEAVESIVKEIAFEAERVKKEMVETKVFSTEGRIASEKVEETFGDILSSTEETAFAIKKNQEVAARQFESVQSVKTTVEAITSIIEGNALTSEEIATGTHKQTEKMENMTKSIESLNAVANQLKALSEQFKTTV